jgi:hypothetical protein
MSLLSAPAAVAEVIYGAVMDVSIQHTKME